MKWPVFLLLLGALSLSARAGDNSNGFLVFEIDRYAYKAGSTNNVEIKQTVKVPLTREFLSNFKHLPSQNSSGTGFVCSGREQGDSAGSTGFTWWLNKTADQHWFIHMWGTGFEKIDGVQVGAMNPSVTQSMTVKKLEDIDMSYQVSYVHDYDGVNVEFEAKFMSAKEVNAQGNIPTAPVQKTDRSFIFKGDAPTNCPVKFSCLFQEG